MKKYLYMYKGWLTLAIVVYMTSGGVVVLLAILEKQLVNAGINHDWKQFKYAIILACLFVASSFISMYLSGKVSAIYSMKVNKKLKSDLFEKILALDIESFQGKNSAEYLSVMNNDVKLVEENYFADMISLVGEMGRGFIICVSLLFFQPLMSIIAVILSFIPMLVPLIVGDRLSKKKEEYFKFLEKYNVKLKDFFTGFELIKTYKIENRVNGKFKTSINELEESNCKCEILKYGIQACTTTVFFASSILRNIIAIVFILFGKMTLGDMFAINSLAGNMSGSIQTISSVITGIKGTKAIRNKLESILSEDRCPDKERLIQFDGINDIRTNNLSFRYKDSGLILDHINLEIKKNCKYAIVGGSGSGKSTLMKLLLGYYDNYAGEINMNGYDIRKINKESIYYNIAMVHQNVFIFDGTLRDNIALFDEVGDDELEEAAKQAGLYELVNKAEDKFDSNINENGGNFSGGEKQRIAIARAFIRKNSFLMMDEATSGLDNQTSYDIESRILDQEGLTAIVVTHKFNKTLLEKYDEIFVMKNGHIIEQGKFNELMKKKQYFYDLYSIGV